jgi:hypothetical protein
VLPADHVPVRQLEFDLENQCTQNVPAVSEGAEPVGDVKMDEAEDEAQEVQEGDRSAAADDRKVRQRSRFQ